MIQIPVATHFLSSPTSTSKCAALAKVSGSDAGTGRASKSEFSVCQSTNHRQSWANMSTPESRPSVFPRFWADIEVDEDDFGIESDVCSEDPAIINDNRDEQVITTLNVRDQSERDIFCKKAQYAFVPQQSDCQVALQENPANMDDSYAMKEHEFSQDYSNHINFSQQSDYQLAFQQNTAIVGDSYPMEEHEFFPDYSNYINFCQQSDYQVAFQKNSGIIGDSYAMEEHEFSPDYSNHMNFSQQSDCQVAFQQNSGIIGDSYVMEEHEFSPNYSNHMNFSQQSDYQIPFSQNPAIVGDSYAMEEHEFFPDYSNHMNLSEQSDYMHKALVDCGIQPVPISILDSLDDEMKTISKHGKTVESPPVPVSILLSIDSDDCAGNDEKSDVRDGPGNFKSTIMVRNVPKKITRDMLLNHFGNRGLLNDINFLNVPVDTRHSGNVGYCFINLVSPAAKERVVRALHGCTLDSDNARVCQVVDAKLHGLDANIELFYKSAVLPKLKKQYYPVVVEHGVVKRLPLCPAKIMK